MIRATITLTVSIEFDDDGTRDKDVLTQMALDAMHKQLRGTEVIEPHVDALEDLDAPEEDADGA